MTNVTSSCDDESDWSSTVVFHQVGCGSVEATGLKGSATPVPVGIDDNVVTIGPGNFEEDGGTTTLTMVLTLVSDTRMVGTETWSWQGPGDSCFNGTADVTATDPFPSD